MIITNELTSACNVDTTGAPDIVPSPDRAYAKGCPSASYDGIARVSRLNEEKLKKAILCLTLGLILEAETEDPELATAFDV